MSLKTLLATFEDEKRKIVTPDLKFKEKDKQDFSLKGFLQRKRMKFLREGYIARQGITFSPSTVTYSYCRRAKVAQMAGKTDLWYERAAPALQTTFDMGNMIHDLIQGYFWDIGVLEGTYKCIKCDELFHGLIAPQECPSGKYGHGKKYLKYKEIKVESEKYYLRGRMDCILRVEPEKQRIADIKSIQARTIKTPQQAFCFEDLDERGPKPDHVVQLNLYYEMSGIYEGDLLYFNKNTGQIKTFSIPYDKTVIQPYLNEILHLVQLAEHWKKGELEKKDLPVCCGRKDCPCETF